MPGCGSSTERRFAESGSPPGEEGDYIAAVLLIHLALALSVTAAAPDLKIAQGTFRFVGVSDELRAFIPEHVSQRLQRPGLKVVTPNDIQNLLGMERQRELMGCSEGTGCTAELIGALGADGLLVGEVARVGDQLQVNLKILSGRSGETQATFARRIDQENKLLELLDAGADELAGQLLAVHTPPTRRVLGAAFWVPTAVAIAGLAGGGIALGLAAGKQQSLLTPQSSARSLDAGRQLVREGELLQTLGFVGVGVGAAAALTAAVAFGLAAQVPISASVSLGPGAAALTFGGTFP